MAFYHCSIKTPKSGKGKIIPGKKHADYINREGDYKNFDNKQKIAASHAEYINRQNDFSKENFIKRHGRCVYKANKLPKWANGSASNFLKLLIYMDVQMVYPIVSLNWRCKKNLLWNKI